MMRFVKKLQILVLVMVTCSVGFAQTDLEGDVGGILTADGSPYRVVDNVFVPFNEVLKIEQGVRIEFAPGTQLVVSGTLEILGTASQPIIITGSSEGNPWKGISISGKEADGGHISYAEISGCTIGIQFRDVQYVVSNTLINALERAFLITDDANVTLDAVISAVTADKLSATAMKVKDSKITVRDSRFSVFADVIEVDEHLLGMYFDNTRGSFETSQVSVSSPSAAVYAMNFVNCASLDVNHCSVRIVTGHSSAISGLSSASIQVSGSSNIAFDHMSIDLGVPNSMVYGIYASGTTYVYLTNSIIANTTGTNAGSNIPFYLNTTFSPRIVARYNCLYFVYIDEESDVDNFDYIIENPRWVSPIDQDYHLSAGSPCIDAGNPDPNEPRDPDGTVTDLGLHYFHQLSGPETGENNTPEKFALESAYPNPFNSSVRFNVLVDQSRNTNISIFDVLGRQVSSIYSGHLASGKHSFHWNGLSGFKPVSSGIYFIQVRSQNQIITQRIQLVR